MPVVTTWKKCNKCDTIKDIEHFYAARSVCKSCVRQKASDHYRVSRRAIKCPCCEANLTLLRFRRKHGQTNDEDVELRHSPGLTSDDLPRATVELTQVAGHGVNGSASDESR